MSMWMVAFAVTGILNGIPDGLPVAPTDIDIGSQHVDLREPLVARTRGARLVLLVRERKTLGDAAVASIAGFESSVPRGSVTARLRDDEGHELVLEHTGYAYHRGYAGLVLSSSEALDNQRFDALEIDSDFALPGVHFVWLDRATRQLQDVRQLP
jgi:hypothetical protein